MNCVLAFLKAIYIRLFIGKFLYLKFGKHHSLIINSHSFIIIIGLFRHFIDFLSGDAQTNIGKDPIPDIDNVEFNKEITISEIKDQRMVKHADQIIIPLKSLKILSIQ